MEEIFNAEIEKKILALTKASFKVADLIPDLVFREKTKSHILNFYNLFFSDFYEGGKNHRDLVKEIDILDKLFYLAWHLNLAKEENVRLLRNGFLVFKSRLTLLNSGNQNKSEPITQTVKNISDKNPDDLNLKQKKIMEKFESKNILKLAEILEIFPDISERTVRNELTSLINLGKITRNGNGNGSFYRLIR